MTERTIKGEIKRWQELSKMANVFSSKEGDIFSLSVWLTNDEGDNAKYGHKILGLQDRIEHAETDYPVGTDIEFVEYEKNGKWFHKLGSFKVISFPNPTTATNQVQVQPTKDQQVAQATTPIKPVVGTRDNYWENKAVFDSENSARISKQATINSAIEIVKLESVNIPDEKLSEKDYFINRVIEVSNILQKYVYEDDTKAIPEDDVDVL